MRTAESSSYDRFIAVVAGQWEMGGAAGMSARQISGLTDAPVSSIYHHFGSLEHLFLASQQQCIVEAKFWCDRQWQQFDGLDASPAAFAGFFAQIVDAWCEERRELAFAWRECQLLAQQSALFVGAAREWAALWERFWSEAGARFGLGAGSIVAQRVFENESLFHMIRWRRLVDRPALDETARVLGAWLTGTAMPPAPWREFAREEALRSMPVLPDRDETAARIVETAAQIIDESGLARLTHRAVAERARLTLGTVSHKFRTKPALLEAAFEGLYRANLTRLQADVPARAALLTRDVADDLAGMVLRGGSARGGYELFVATARDPALRQFGAQLRYLRGRTSRGAMQELVGDGREIGITEAALFSGFLTSQLRAHDGFPTEIAPHIRSELDVLIALARAVPSGGQCRRGTVPSGAFGCL
ncbi:MAG: TetR family transcriptional regulator [Novosphingobium sp.]